jgi:hypothetical protein
MAQIATPFCAPMAALERADATPPLACAPVTVGIWATTVRSKPAPCLARASSAPAICGPASACATPAPRRSQGAVRWVSAPATVTTEAYVTLRRGSARATTATSAKTAAETCASLRPSGHQQIFADASLRSYPNKNPHASRPTAQNSGSCAWEMSVPTSQNHRYRPRDVLPKRSSSMRREKRISNQNWIALLII